MKTVTAATLIDADWRVLWLQQCQERDEAAQVAVFVQYSTFKSLRVAE